MKKLKSIFSKFDFIIIIISIVTLFIVLNLPFKAKPFGDDTFHLEAKKIALYIKGNVSFDQVTITKAPGPVLFYTIVYVLVPSDASDNTYWSYAVIFTSILLIISMLLIFRICKCMFSSNIGFLSVVLFFLFPIHFYYSLGILAEVPAFFSLTIALFGWSKVFKRVNDKTGWALFILGSCFLILNRPNALLLLPISLAIVFYAYFRNKLFFNKFGLKIMTAVFIIGFLSFAFLEFSKSITNTKSEKKQEELLYYVSHQGRFQFREEPLDLRYWESDIRPDSRDYQNWIKSTKRLNTIVNNTSKSYNEVYRSFLINDFLEQPFLFIRQFFVKSLYGQIYFINSIDSKDFKLLFFKGKTGYLIFHILLNSINILILIGFIIFLMKEKDLLKYWYFLAIIIALLIFHAITYMEPRYMFPSRIPLYIMSASGLNRLNFIKKWVSKATNILT